MQLLKKVPFATREQELLLQAALLEGEDAISAWQQWRSMVDLEGYLDNGSFRLLPLLYKNLQLLRIEDPFMNKLKGLYKQAWCKNQILFYDISKVLQYLHDAGIQTMILKGAALIVLHYKNYAVRPMADFDILVPTSQALPAINLLNKAGWIQTDNLIDVYLCSRNSMKFIGKSGKELDLHWHLLGVSCQEVSDMVFWEGVVSIRINEVSSFALNPTDTLLHVIVHGVSWNPEPPIRWIADAISLINSSDTEIEWIRLINQVKTHRVVLKVKEALNYLHEKFQAPIPKSVMDKINRIPISFTEHLEYHYITRSPFPNTFLGTLLGNFQLHLVRYSRLTNGTGLLWKIIGFPKYLQCRLSAKSLHGLFFYLIFRNIRITKKELLLRLYTDKSR